jgi:LDH2 family malate/lactate/ureidoglycolate dehydrogenase
MNLRYSHAELQLAVGNMFRRVGMEADKADRVTDSLLDADMMGHATHGLALIPWYFDAIEAGGMGLSGNYEVVSERAACMTWNGNRLPGAWLFSRAIDIALERIAEQGVVTVSIFNSHHTGALAVYLPRLTERGLMGIVSSSAASVGTVAPYGGTRGLLAPNPIAAGIPTDGDPILIDVSASITTNNNARQLVRAGGRFPSPWALDAQGNPSDDPAVAVSGGSLLPIGGLDHGHKGYALGLLVEALTHALPGFGRADKPTGIVTGAYLQVIDPEAFGGREAYIRQTGWLAQACRDNPPRPGVERVRLPGEQAMKNYRTARAEGVPLTSTVVDALMPYAQQCGISFPSPRG